MIFSQYRLLSLRPSSRKRFVTSIIRSTFRKIVASVGNDEGMFLSRLDAAVRESRGALNAVLSSPQKKSTEKPVKSRLLSDLNEYLFDLFDANCMEEYHVLQKFEERAILSFMDLAMTESKECDYEHVHFQLHREFVTLFEALIENFLLQHKYTLEEVFAEVERYHSVDYSKGPNAVRANHHNSVELTEVLSFYTDFRTWADMMYDNARYRIRFQNSKK